MLDLDLAQLSMDFDVDFLSDPLLETVMFDESDVPLPTCTGPTVIGWPGAAVPSPSESLVFNAQPPKMPGSKLTRTREKNRLAQARYRERQKVCIVHLQFTPPAMIGIFICVGPQCHGRPIPDVRARDAVKCGGHRLVKHAFQCYLCGCAGFSHRYRTFTSCDQSRLRCGTVQQELTEVKKSVTAAQESLSEARTRLANTKLANEKLVRRAAEAATALLTVIAQASKQNQVASENAASTSTQTGHDRPELTAPLAGACGYPAACPPPNSPITSDTANTPSSGHTADSNLHSTRASDCNNLEVTKKQSTSNLTPCATGNQFLELTFPRQSPLPETAHRAPLDARAVFKAPFPSIASVTRSAVVPPKSPFPVSHPATCNRIDVTPAGATDASSEELEPEAQVAEAIVAEAAERLQAQRRSVAVAAGVRERDVCWFVQMPYRVTPCGRPPQSAAAPPAGPATDAIVSAGAAGAAALSCTTAIASPACMASLFAFFVCSRFEGACLAAALGQPDGASPQQHSRALLAGVCAACAACAAKLLALVCVRADGRHGGAVPVSVAGSVALSSAVPCTSMHAGVVRAPPSRAACSSRVSRARHKLLATVAMRWLGLSVRHACVCESTSAVDTRGRGAHRHADYADARCAARPCRYRGQTLSTRSLQLGQHITPTRGSLYGPPGCGEHPGRSDTHQKHAHSM